MKILGLGAVLVDEISVLPEFPKEDSKIQIIESFKQVGGPVPTTLRVLSALGFYTDFIAKTGKDERAEYIKDKLVDSNVNISNFIEQEGGISGFSQVWINKEIGSRTLAYSSGDLKNIEQNEVDFASLPFVNLVHLDGREPIMANDLAEYYQENSLISIDTGNFRESTLRILPKADIIIMPKRFAVSMFYEDSMENLVLKIKARCHKASFIVITDGGNGAVCWHGGETYSRKAFCVDVVDSNGAGDFHSAGIIYGVLKGFSINEILEFAGALGALKCTKLGNNDLPNIEDINSLIDQQNITA